MRLATYHYNLASSYDQLNQLEQAIEHCKICYEIKKEILGSENQAVKSSFDKLEGLVARLDDSKYQLVSGLKK